MNPATELPPEERPSKSQRKRDSHDLQKLGAELVALGAAQLDRIELPERLREAVVFARGLTAHEARRRQLQFIGKLMRSADAPAIRAAVDAARGDSRASVEVMHRCEQLRERLLDDDDALTGFLAAHPGVDPQWLRAKLRAARHERTQGQPPRHARAIYRWLHELLTAEAGR